MSKRRTVIITASCLTVVVLILVRVALSVMSGPAVGQVSYPKVTKPKAANFDVTPKLADTQYASFNMPRGFTAIAGNKISAPVLGNYNYEYRLSYPNYLSVSILNVPGGDITANNAYQLRKLNPSQYQLSYIQDGQMPVAVMTDTTVSGFNKVAFLANNTYQATVSLTSDDPGDSSSLQAALSMVISTWHWK